MAVKILNHPLIDHKLTHIRKESTPTSEFFHNVEEIAELMAYEITKNYPTKEVSIETPIGLTRQNVLDCEIVIVPILRAGLGFSDGLRKVIPEAKIGIVGLYRDEKTLQPQQYYLKFPKNISSAKVILVDPMLATGGSALAGIQLLKEYGCKDIVYVGLVGAPEGVTAVTTKYPEVDIYLAALDEKLNEKGYIVPGLGDCGDRYFGTVE